MAGITLDRVSKRFADGTVAVNDVSLDVYSGEVVGLVGEVGTGNDGILRREDHVVGELVIRHAAGIEALEPPDQGQLVARMIDRSVRVPAVGSDLSRLLRRQDA